MKSFTLKFLDIMIGLVLGLGFQWWPDLKEPWQFVAFIFVYFDVVDYWIDYAPGLKKFPPKRELDIILDVSIMFSLFLYIYATQFTIFYFLSAFILVRFLDLLWLIRSKYQHNPSGIEAKYINTWLVFDTIECIGIVALLFSMNLVFVSPLTAVSIFIIFRIVARFFASLQYKRMYFT